MRRRRSLDGLRAVGLIAVLLYHSLPESLPGGFLGVEVFFVLSGYLLTSILLREHIHTGHMSLVRYADRRVRRLAPALFTLLAALVVLGPVFARSDAHRLAGDVYSSIAGVTNWHLIADNSSYFGGLGRPSLVRHLWSLAVEIQFYVVCPFLVAWLALRTRWAAVGVVASGIAASTIAMALLFDPANQSRAYYGTDARVGALLTGTLVALVVANWETPLIRRSVARAGRVGLVVLVALFVIAREDSAWLYPFGFLLTRVATAFVILAAMQRSWLGRGLGARPLRWLGERSYGIYLWHWPLVALLRPRIDVTWSPAVAAALTIALAVALGHLSYLLVERPFLKRAPRRSRVLARVQWGFAALATAGMAVLIVDLPTSDPIVSSLRTGEQVVSLQRPLPVTTTTVVAAPPVEPSAAPPPAAVAPPTQPVVAAAPRRAAPVLAGPAPGTVTVAAIGDSVMLGAAPQLQAKFGNTGYIDAKVARQYADGVGVARQLREQGRLGQVVVVHLGTNGPPRDRDVDALMNELAAVPRVLFVTVRMPRKWEGQTNTVLHNAAGRHPKVVLVDWYAHSNGHQDWFRSDGVHLSPAGANAYADVINSELAPPPPPPPPPAEPPPAEPPPAEPPPAPPAEPTTTTMPPDPSASLELAPPPPS